MCLVVLPVFSILSSEVAPIIPGLSRQADGEYAELPGNTLLTELSCTACHEPNLGASLPPKKGPVLTGIFHRIQPSWFAEFIVDPHKVKPGTTMPDVLGKLPDARRDTVVKELTAYLQSFRKPLYDPIKEITTATPVPVMQNVAMSCFMPSAALPVTPRMQPKNFTSLRKKILKNRV